MPKRRRSRDGASAVREAEQQLAAGRLAAAEATCRRALEAQPGLADALVLLTFVRMKQGRWAEAEGIVLGASRLRPQEISLHETLAGLYIFQNRFDEAVEPLQTCCLAQPERSAHRVLLLAAYQHCTFREFSAPARGAMLLCLADDDLTHSLMARAWLSLLRVDPDARDILGLCAARSYDDFRAGLTEGTIATWQRNTFLNTGLTRFIVADAAIERGLTHLRRWFFDRWTAGGGAALDPYVPLLATLAQVCFLREYVFSAVEDPAPLASRIATAGEAALSACYAPLFARDDCSELAARLERAGCRDLVRTQVDEPVAERAIKTEISGLAPVVDDVSRAVREQYEEHPYPRWTSVGRGAELPDHVLRAARGKRILCAGCGTGREAVEAALIFPEASVVALDLSRASLAYAVRKTRERGIQNVTFLQGDLLDVGGLNERFDMIISSGVLHHMKDPARGLETLRQALRPGGALKIGLYSTYARGFISELRASIGTAGLPATLDGIREFRAALLARADDDPFKRRVTAWTDFYATSSCRDLLFHVQERTFTLLDIQAMLEQFEVAVLQVDGPNRDDRKTYLERFRDDPDAVNLAHWDLLERERPAMFAHMYGLWLCRAADRPTVDLSWIRDTNRM